MNRVYFHAYLILFIRISGVVLTEYDEEPCSGEMQSPIGINLKTAIAAKFKPFKENGAFKKKMKNMTVIKNEHSVGVVFRFGTEDEKPGISGGPLTDLYYLDHAHFHWAPSNDEGSEHSVNGLKYPLEMHAVYYNQQFDSLEAAVNTPYGVSIIGYLFEMDREGHPALDVIQEVFEDLKAPGYRDIPTINGFSASELLPHFDYNYVTYKGSLTIQPCSEDVNWIVFLNKLPVTNEQLGKFRSLYANDPTLLINSRSIQDTNDRPVYLVPQLYFV